MRIVTIIAITLLQFAVVSNAFAVQDKKILPLEGSWKFSVGDNKEWGEADFDDSSWDIIKVPGAWENQGFHGYDGYAWYRKTFEFNYDKDFPLILGLGFIDDADEVYFNGELIASRGSFPPHFSTAYDAERRYNIPDRLVNRNGKNTIAIRVYDEWSAGGILWGCIGIFENRNKVPVELDLSGKWKFQTKDCDIDNLSNLDASNWDEIVIPAMWEERGYKNHDGYSCYSKIFELHGEFSGERMVLMLGKIDDFDQVYLNGELIGQHGKMPDGKLKREHYSYYNETRGYYIPENILNHTGKNTIVVRVYDVGGTGGIYSGDIGLISQKKYIQFWRNKND